MRSAPLTSLLSAAVLLGAGASLPRASAETATATSEETLLSVDFDHDVDSSATQKLLAHKSIHLAEGEGPDGGDAVLVDYVGYPRGSERVVVWFPLKRMVDTATLSFDVRFDEEFQWVKVGKLHGLGPAEPITGGKDRTPDGWSSRVMWQPEGRCMTYVYDQNPDEKWGHGNKSTGPVFVPGEWTHVDYQVHVNAVGEADGFARIWINGEEVAHTEDVPFRGVGGDTAISKFMFSTFHGGNTPEFAPKDADGNFAVDHAWFDNLVVREGEYVEPTKPAS